MNLALLQNSLLVSGAATLLAVGFGVMCAVLAMSLGSVGRRATIIIAAMALCLPPFLSANTWLHYLGMAGVWRSWVPLNILTPAGCAWVLSLLLWPIPFLALLGVWSGMGRAELESDPAVCGNSFLLGLLLPRARGALVQSVVVTFVLALNQFSVPALLQVKVYPAEMWIRYNTGLDVTGALALSWPLVLAPLALLWWLRGRAFPWRARSRMVEARAFRRQAGLLWIASATVIGILAMLASVGLPLFQLASDPRTWSEFGGALKAGGRALANSALLAVLGAALCLAVGFIGHRSRLLGLLWLTFLVPGTVTGVLLLVSLNRPGADLLLSTSGAALLALVLHYAGVSGHLLRRAIRGADRVLVDDARLLGASQWEQFRHVYWPQVATQAGAAFYLVYLLCLWDVESTLLVVPPGGETLALRIFNLLHTGYSGQVNALCMVLLILGLVPLGLAGLAALISRKRQHGAVLALVATSLLPVWFGLGCGSKADPRRAPLTSKFFNSAEVFGTRGTGAGQLNKPRSVTAEPDGSVYVVDMTGRVQKFGPDGAYQLSWQMEQTDLGRPKGLCLDREGRVVVNEPHYSRVNHFSPEGKLVFRWGNHGTNAGQLAFPRAVAVNSKGEIVLSEYGLVERVQRFSADGRTFLGTFGRPGQQPGEFNRAEGLCVDAQDRIYVADSCNHRIQIFAADGTFLRTYGKAGAGPGELSYPYDICVDPQGFQFVCEFGNSRIQVFDPNGNSVEIIGGPGAEPGRFNNPWGVALDGAGNLYVADSQNHRVQKLVRQGRVAIAEAGTARPRVDSVVSRSEKERGRAVPAPGGSSVVRGGGA
jgi:ABC-type Fe3+ transport system permease subunit/DNA-binding beta-propeller fold protein YncE